MTKTLCRAAFAEVLAENPDIFVIATDSRGSAGVSGFAERFPERFVELGIAEQNAIGFAAGLASTGQTVFVCGPACFITARGYEQIKVDIAYNRTNVKLIGVSAGVSYGPLGGTHTALHDIAGLRALPNLTVLVPSDAAQTAALTRRMLAHDGPVYMRMGRGAVPDIYPGGECFDLPEAKLLRQGGDITLMACGEMVHHALQAAERLAAQGISARVLDFYCLKPADESAIIAAARETGKIITLEEHSIHGGLGELVCAVTARHCPVPVRVLGFPDEEIKVGKSEELLAHYGLTAEGIAAQALELLEVTA